MILEAKKFIKKHLKNENVDIHFLIGGTSTNQIVIASCLRPFEGVLTVETGHINCHETGAVEATGHKVISLTKELNIERQNFPKAAQCLKAVIEIMIDDNQNTKIRHKTQGSKDERFSFKFLEKRTTPEVSLSSL